MKRVPESELMTGSAQADAYASADFTESNSIFINQLFEMFEINKETKILDIGCGDGEIPINIYKKQVCNITAVDGSQSMLNEFYKKLKISKIKKIKIINAMLNDELLTNEKFDIVMSNSLIHHVKDVSLYWHNLIRLINKTGMIMCMDLERPSSEARLKRILNTYGGSNSILKNDFENSLRAAYTLDEIKLQLVKINEIAFTAKQVSDRHFFVTIKLRQ